MRILFAGTPDIAVPSLRELARRYTICGVLTSPDREAGRGRHTVESPVKLQALELGVPVVQPPRLGSDARRHVGELSPQLLVVFAFGRIFGPKFLALFPKGAINVHPSLLPKYRGPSPIPAAILAGDSETGVTVQEVSEEMDAGDIYAQTHIPLTGGETAESLGALVSQEAASLVSLVVEEIEAGTARPRPQPRDGVSYCSMITKQDGEIDWHSPANQIDRMVRAYLPWPTAYTSYEGRKLSILEAEPVRHPAHVESSADPGVVLGLDKARGILIQTGSGILAVRRLQLQSKKALDYKSFWNGVHGFEGALLGNV